jgi:hypothetical protein
MRLTPLILASLLAGSARADDAVATYAIVVGSNAGGPGQTDLRYSEDDARRMATVLTELGGYPADHVDLVVHPSPAVLLEHVQKVAERVEADHAAGKQSRLFFYYSGHARSTALDLGSEELALADLRQRLLAVPAGLTVIVLDACQSGAFSRIKGAAPAADFSFNSRQHLDATGIAVLASSTGSELSQESEQLKSSYFTHHLLVGLRGAGDANGDGQVSIDEAYRYAYHQTLLATAETAVGGQHVSLEVELKGHGEVPLTFPRAATSWIDLPARLEGKTLVEDRKAHAVIAETYKAKGAAVRIAVAPGDYEVLVRHGSTLSHCSVSGGGVVDLDHCRDEAIVTTRTKGGGFTRPTRVEISTALGLERHDAYTDTLSAFGYEEELLPFSAGLNVTVLRKIHPNVWVGGSAGGEMLPRWTRETDGIYPLRFDMSMLRAAAVGRGEITLYEIFKPASAWWYRQLDPLHLYAQVELGAGMGRTTLRDQSGMNHSDSSFGAAFATEGGLLIGGGDTNRFFKGLGISFAYRFEYAPVITNLFGDTHAVGGHRLGIAMSYSF